MLSNEVIFFAGFIAVISFMLLLDLGVFSKTDHEVKFKEAAAWTFVWVAMSMGFYFIIRTHGDLVHGVDNFSDLFHIAEKYAPHLNLLPGDFERSLEIYRSNMATEYITGYLLEYALSIDNIFVIILIFTSFNVAPKYYKKVLFWGVLGAVLMRFVFIFVGSALIQQFSWIIYIFGLLLVYQGGKIFFEKDDDETIDPGKHPVVKFASKYLPVFPRYVKEHFFVRTKEGKFYFTPLFVVVLIIEFTDLIFAVDSVPAVFAVTKDPYVVFFSNIFAIMGLRSMFFFLSNIVGLFRFLKYGLGVLLVFIGCKMLAHSYLDEIGFKTVYSLYIILGILAVSILASVLIPEKKKLDKAV